MRHPFLASVIVALVAGPATAQDLTPVQDNRDKLIEMALEGKPSPPTMGSRPYRVRADGQVEMVPGSGGIMYNARVGTSAVDMEGNHVEPAVSIRAGENNSDTNNALNALATIGSPVRVLSGRGADGRGRVIGKHGGSNRVMVDVPDKVIEEISYTDLFQIRALGAGMKFLNVEGVTVMNAHPDLIDALTERGMGVTAEGKLRVPVHRVIPARIMGSGLGRDHTYAGDYDIQMFDEGIVRDYGLEALRFGDIVAIENADTTYGRIYKTGAMTVGVVVHGKSMSAGHGPGVTTLFTSAEGNIETFRDDGANLQTLLDIR